MIDKYPLVLFRAGLGRARGTAREVSETLGFGLEGMLGFASGCWFGYSFLLVVSFLDGREICRYVLSR